MASIRQREWLLVKLKKGKYLILAVSIFFVLGSITIVSNNSKVNENSNLIIAEDNNDLFKENYKGNLVIESDDNNTVTTEEELEENGSVRILPKEEAGDIIILPNPSYNEEVILNKL